MAAPPAEGHAGARGHAGRDTPYVGAVRVEDVRVGLVPRPEADDEARSHLRPLELEGKSPVTPTTWWRPSSGRGPLSDRSGIAPPVVAPPGRTGAAADPAHTETGHNLNLSRAQVT